MNKPSFHIANQEIADFGCEILDSEYHKEAFGNWYITIDNESKTRMVWDVKDAELSIQKITDEMFNGSPIWETVWSKVKPSKSDFRDGISKFKKQAV